VIVTMSSYTVDRSRPMRRRIPRSPQLPSSTDLLYKSSGCSVRNTAPIVRLRWTDRDLIAMVAD
jgi:hypothetical protein